MTGIITLTTAGADTGPFVLYSDLDGFTSSFESGVSLGDLLAGYISNLIPDGTTVVRVMSVGMYCNNYVDIPTEPLVTTTTTTTIAEITTTTSTTFA